MTIDLDLLDEESATEAIKTVAEIAEANDISFIADKLPPIEKVGELRQGGERYLIKTGERWVY